MNKLKTKNTLYNDPMYDVVVDSRMLEQHLKEKDQQIAELKKQLKSQPAEIVEKIKETAILDVEEYSIEPILYKITEEELDTILKEYQK